MRKLYALLAGMFIVLSAILAKPPAPDVAHFTFTIDQVNNNTEYTNTSVRRSEPGIGKPFRSFGDGACVFIPPLQGTQRHCQWPDVCL